MKINLHKKVCKCRQMIFVKNSFVKTKIACHFDQTCLHLLPQTAKAPIRVYIKFESKLAAFLDTHLLHAGDAGTKKLIGCKWVMDDSWEQWIVTASKYTSNVVMQ